jgi:hypothetical protein
VKGRCVLRTVYWHIKGHFIFANGVRYFNVKIRENAGPRQASTQTDVVITLARLDHDIF